MSALVSACIANLFAAFKGNENKKLMETDGITERLGSVGNQFAVTTILGFFMSIPLVIAKGEAAKFGQFVELFKSTPTLSANLIASGLWFYGYNELSTMTLKKTGAVTQSVANTFLESHSILSSCSDAESELEEFCFTPSLISFLPRRSKYTSNADDNSCIISGTYCFRGFSLHCALIWECQLEFVRLLLLYCTRQRLIL